MSGLAGVPDATRGLAGYASRPFPISASAPQGSPCELALCRSAFGVEKNRVPRSAKRESARKTTSFESRFGSGACRGGSRVGGWASVRGPRCVVERTISARACGGGREELTRSRFGARVSPVRDDAPVETRWVFRYIAARKGEKGKKRESERAGQPRASRTRAGSRAGGLWRAYHCPVGAKARARACFGSCDVALCRVNELRVRRANGRGRKISGDRAKTAGRDWTRACSETDARYGCESSTGYRLQTDGRARGSRARNRERR